ILAGIVERDGTVTQRREHRTPVTSTEALLTGIDAAVEELLDDGVGALGFGVPMSVDQPRGRAVAAPNIPLADFPFRDRMRDRYGLPTALENDANAATIAEWAIGAG